MRFTTAEESRYAMNLNTYREKKNDYFKKDPASPLTTEEKKIFQALPYYPANFDLIFDVRLKREKNPSSISIQATGGETRPAIRFGKFNFEVGGKPVSLNVYKMSEDQSNELFVPFVDKTSGGSSYGGGRYLDLEENTSGEYVLDFNYCYNPYCAYNHDYSCPIVPGENKIEVPITAGEMKFGNQ